MYVNHIIMLYILNLHSDVRQLFLNKNEKQLKTETQVNFSVIPGEK